MSRIFTSNLASKGNAYLLKMGSWSHGSGPAVVISQPSPSPRTMKSHLRNKAMLLKTLTAFSSQNCEMNLKTTQLFYFKTWDPFLHFSCIVVGEKWTFSLVGIWLLALLAITPPNQLVVSWLFYKKNKMEIKGKPVRSMVRVKGTLLALNRGWWHRFY